MSICNKIKEMNDSIEQFKFDESARYVDLKLSQGDVHAARREALNYGVKLMDYFETETEKYKFFIIK
ncbi:hypothetical protein HON86_03700 [Candidatus Woesearchaeota archaeon]|jgi:hypothetical protein|nr:hypothetical protein [Candidatus Woesearchaeota archaeon]MBT4835688.1 hypothetical protein [Candidatus Woesearchaeota archaeon]MBT6735310.1 hypothetical protein [Candidatus Woesearchaeota archaeon]MBT7169482.1 hypothetical protein [Candidatus Woesearchaeota archaeon]MBT7474692.1 hypothetical protein [Candidatus Woesearchaeota archaeon]